MTTPHPRPPQTALRNPISWFFIAILVLYLLYSIDLILNKRFNCALPINSDNFFTKKFIQTDNTTNSVTSTALHALGPEPTQLKHIAFGVAASSFLWENRKEYIKQWWRPGETRGVVWLDKQVRIKRNERLPEIRISADTSEFKYSNRQGDRSAVRISRVVSETFRLGMKDIRWFVMGDDDTVFMVENVVRVLSKYDHNQLYYGFLQ